MRVPVSLWRGRPARDWELSHARTHELGPGGEGGGCRAFSSSRVVPSAHLPPPRRTPHSQAVLPGREEGGWDLEPGGRGWGAAVRGGESADLQICLNQPLLLLPWTTSSTQPAEVPSLGLGDRAQAYYSLQLRFRNCSLSLHPGVRKPAERGKPTAPTLVLRPPGRCRSTPTGD